MSDDITHDLDLLDDWLAGKGYGEEAGLVLRALSLIHKLQDGVRSTIQERDVLSGENFDLRAENEKLRADVEDTKALLPNKHEADAPLRPTEHHDWWCVSIMERRKRVAAEKKIEKLRAALKPLADEVEYVPSQMDDDDWYEMDTIQVGHIRAAAAALKETGDE